jgi:pentose-5-phosphate-3-epimerase
MVIDYEHSTELIDQIKSLIRIDTVFIHTSLHPHYSLLQKKYPLFRIGLVINPEEDVISIHNSYDFKTISLIQLMTIHPGPQGQPFIHDALNKIEQLQNCGFLGKIYIDGAINETTIPLLKPFLRKSDVLCPGSYLAKSPAEDLKRRVDFLQL